MGYRRCSFPHSSLSCPPLLRFGLWELAHLYFFLNFISFYFYFILFFIYLFIFFDFLIYVGIHSGVITCSPMKQFDCRGWVFIAHMFRASHKQWEVAILIKVNTSASIKFRIVEMDNWLNLNTRPCWLHTTKKFSPSPILQIGGVFCIDVDQESLINKQIEK